MQLDLAERGFSFMRDGPLDMRMVQDGQSAADIVNDAEKRHCRHSVSFWRRTRRRRRHLRERLLAPITNTIATGQDCREVSAPPSQPGKAIRDPQFQALRIAVNDEYGELVRGLMAAERALETRWQLAGCDVSFGRRPHGQTVLHRASGNGGNANRFAPRSLSKSPRSIDISPQGDGPR